MAAPASRARLAPSRDTLATIRDDGSRIFQHPADVRGRFTRWRRAAALLLAALYAGLPWISIGGAPAVLMDAAALRFHFFGVTLAAQDMWLAFFLVTGTGFALFYATALFGRLWCGWACPQTVFLEHVYRRIERALEGDAPARRRLDQAPWDASKLLRRGTKHLLFVLVSLLIVHVFLAYFVPLPRLFAMVAGSPLEHWPVFLFVAAATGILTFNFAWFREQLCIVLCPYGRLQSALVDDHSVVIGYDERRGEPRGRRQRPEGGGQKAEGEAPRAEIRGRRADVRGQRSEDGGQAPGDCIDCLRCVQVCPTGIDIRQGLQLECIACSNCIDACDEVMDKAGRPRGLVRYDSLTGLAGGRTRFLRPRIVLYSVLLAVGAAAAVAALAGYRPATLAASRMVGAPYYVDGDAVRNQFLVRLINKQASAAVFTATVVGGPGAPSGLAWTGWAAAVPLAPGAEVVQPLVVFVPRSAYRGAFAFTVRAESADGQVAVESGLSFVGPDPRLFHASHGDVP